MHGHASDDRRKSRRRCRYRHVSFPDRCQIDDVVGEIRHGIVVMQLPQHRQAVGGLHVPALRTLQLRTLVPRIHDRQNCQREQHGEPTAAQELCHGSEEEHELDGQKQHGEYDGAEPSAGMPDVDGQQNRGGDHRDGQRQTVGG